MRRILIAAILLVISGQGWGDYDVLFDDRLMRQYPQEALDHCEELSVLWGFKGFDWTLATSEDCLKAWQRSHRKKEHVPRRLIAPKKFPLER